MSKLWWIALVVALTAGACGGTTSGEMASSNDLYRPPIAVDLSPPSVVWPEQRDLVYGWIGEGDTATADLIRDGVWDLPRFDPVDLGVEPTWTEDPYDEGYWRFIFYGLRPLRHLIGAYEETGDPAYLETLAVVLGSFADARDTSPYVAEPHAAAFRTMIQVASYGTLSRAGLLDADLEASLRESIGKDAALLADPAKYQGTYNHGFTEAAALLLVAETFPSTGDLGDVARGRLDRLMVESVDGDGVEVENSPFYHFYVMGFAADIAAWAQRNAIALPASFTTRLDRMVDYATWIVMPNSQVPLVGSSLARTVDTASADELAGFAAEHPEFDFVLSRGVAGEAPETNSILFPESGTAVLRSGFGTVDTYGQETHIVFDVGPYRTDHSQLDALSVNVYAAGAAVLPDSGLFTYEPGADYDYFHGTAAHNTVLVDGQDQSEGTAIAGLSTAGDGWSYQSGSHELYPGVLHRRAVLLVDRELIAVVDLLDSSEVHDFTQLWHFAPDLDVRVEGGEVVAISPEGSAVVRIEQAGEGGIPVTSFGDEGLYAGWYSEKYEMKLPSTVASYSAAGKTARFVTLLALGPAAESGATMFDASGSADDVDMSLCGPDYSVSVDIRDLAGADESVVVKASDCSGAP